MFDLIIRSAQEQDCRDIARLFLIGSQGLAEFIWGRACQSGETVIDVGAHRCARKNVPFSFKNCMLVEIEGRTIALLHIYEMEPSAGPGIEEIEPVLRPFATLTDVGSLYLSALVVDAEYRGRGIGLRLLETAEQHAAVAAFPRLSVVVLQRNQAAMRFNRRAGFVEIDRAPLWPHPALRDWTGDAILLTKSMDKPSKMSESKSQEK